MKKSNATSTLAAKLSRLRDELREFERSESESEIAKILDDIVAVLVRLRGGLNEPSVTTRAAEILTPLSQVIDFLESAKSDEALKLSLLLLRKAKPAKPKREPAAIAPNLTNDQIRELLATSLSKSELKAIATQRSISVTGLNNTEVKRNILKNLDRQEGYDKLSSS